MFSDSKEGVALFLGLCSALRSMFYLLWLLDKIGYFSKDRTYREFFVVFDKRTFYSDAPQDLNAFLTFVYAADTAN